MKGSYSHSMHEFLETTSILKNCNSNFSIFTRHPIPMFWNSEWTPTPSNSSHGKSRIAIQLPHGSTKQRDLGLTGVIFISSYGIHHVVMRDSEIPCLLFPVFDKVLTKMSKTRNQVLCADGYLPYRHYYVIQYANVCFCFGPAFWRLSIWKRPALDFESAAS